MVQNNHPFHIDISPLADKQHMLTRNGVRFTVLTSSLLRVEKQHGGKFCDKATQSVWFRDFDCPDFTVNESDSSIEIKTNAAKFIYSLREKKMLGIVLADGRPVSDFNAGNLGGTCRTLDVSAGVAVIGNGVISKSGVAVFDDSDTLTLDEESHIAPREAKESDLYYFAYGYDYIGALRDFYRLTGKTPLIPRFALSNWWSRYKAYTQQEYLTLMERFMREEIPITVATVDMDWHWVNIKKKFGKEAMMVYKHRNLWEYIYDVWSPGWTGYSFNTDLFPDPQGFLNTLKSENLKVTFNLHPAQGVRWYEDAYPEMCRRTGQNPSEKKPVEFDITDPKFIDNYFNVLHHPLEKMGVDFWWIDWQQGTKTAIPGLDPLWALNHYHFYDSARNGKRPLILSRFAGAGSQRYPLGFSGDTTQRWKSLDFQPGFTATSANIGYPWWSHDIGGHCFGKKDDELYLRWLQLGVFSPIMRLHSTANEFMGKEPWKYSGSTERIAVRFLRLRHKLLPYIYTMNRRTERDGRALCEPLYYTYPKEKAAYEVKNEYFFGSELIVSPITEPASPETNMASVKTFIPEGRYTDLFTGRIYCGPRFVRLYRDVESIPVLAKEGAILPMSVNDRSNDTSNPTEMEITVLRGKNTFRLYEDDGETLRYLDGTFAETPLSVEQRGTSVYFTIDKAEGDTGVLPEKRCFTLLFRDIVTGSVSVTVGGRRRTAFTVNTDKGFLSVTVKNVTPNEKVEITIDGCTFLANADKKEQLIETISKFQASNNRKGSLYTGFVFDDKPLPPFLSEAIRGPIEEILALYRG